MGPEFMGNRHINVVRSALHTVRLYHPGDVTGLRFCYSLSGPQNLMWPEGLSQSKIRMALSGIELANFRLEA